MRNRNQEDRGYERSSQESQREGRSWRPDYSGRGRDWGSESYEERSGRSREDQSEFAGGYRDQSQGQWGEEDEFTRSRGWEGRGGASQDWSGGSSQYGQRSWNGPGRDRFGSEGYGAGQRSGGAYGGFERQRQSGGGGSNRRGSGLQYESGLGHRGKGPKGYTRSDDRIREEVSDALMADDDIDASDIEVEVRSGEVTLTGTVESREAKRSSEDLAEQVQGVKNVQNSLRVSRENGRENGQAAQNRRDETSGMSQRQREASDTRNKSGETARNR